MPRQGREWPFLLLAVGSAAASPGLKVGVWGQRPGGNCREGVRTPLPLPRSPPPPQAGPAHCFPSPGAPPVPRLLRRRLWGAPGPNALSDQVTQCHRCRWTHSQPSQVRSGKDPLFPGELRAWASPGHTGGPRGQRRHGSPGGAVGGSERRAPRAGRPQHPHCSSPRTRAPSPPEMMLGWKGALLADPPAAPADPHLQPPGVGTPPPRAQRGTPAGIFHPGPTCTGVPQSEPHRLRGSAPEPGSPAPVAGTDPGGSHL